MKKVISIFCLFFAPVVWVQSVGAQDVVPPVAVGQSVEAQSVVPQVVAVQNVEAQPDQPDQRTLHIDSVVVRSHFLDRSVIPAQVLMGDDLQRLGAVSVADAIRYFSGAQIKDYGGVGGLKTVNVRSLGAQHVGVFYDGVQIGNSQNGTVDLGRFSMDNMEAVALYNGQKSDIFQSAKDFASASAVYLTTRRPIFEGDKRYNLRISLKAGSFWTANPSILWEQRIGKNREKSVESQLSAEFLYTTGRYKFRTKKADGYDTTEVRQNSDVRALRAEWGLFGRLPKGDWRTKLYYYGSERGIPGAVDPGIYPKEGRQWDRNIFVQATVRQFLGRANLNFVAKYSNDWLRYLARPGYNDSPTDYTDNRYLHHEGYVSVASEFRLFDWWRMSVSTDGQFDKLDAKMSMDPAGAYPSRATALTAAAASFNWRVFTFQASVLYTFVRDFTRDRAAGNAAIHTDRHRWSPTAVASLRPFRRVDLTLRAFYKRIFRLPTLTDIYYSDTESTAPPLDPETTSQYNAGLAYSTGDRSGFFRRFDASVDGYFNQIHNKIVYVPQRNLFRWTAYNLGYVEIRGVDAAMTLGFQAGAVAIDIRANYTWQRAQDLTRPADQWFGGQVPYIPWHSGSALVALTWRGWGLNYSFIYTGERYTSRANTPENHLQPWYTHDLALSKTVRLKRSELRVSGELNNFLNQAYEVVLNYPMPGINFRIKVEWTI